VRASSTIPVKGSIICTIPVLLCGPSGTTVTSTVRLTSTAQDDEGDFISPSANIAIPLTASSLSVPEIAVEPGTGFIITATLTNRGTHPATATLDTSSNCPPSSSLSSTLTGPTTCSGVAVSDPVTCLRTSNFVCTSGGNSFDLNNPLPAGATLICQYWGLVCGDAGTGSTRIVMTLTDTVTHTVTSFDPNAPIIISNLLPRASIALEDPGTVDLFPGDGDGPMASSDICVVTLATPVCPFAPTATVSDCGVFRCLRTSGFSCNVDPTQFGVGFLQCTFSTVLCDATGFTQVVTATLVDDENSSATFVGTF